MLFSELLSPSPRVFIASLGEPVYKNLRKDFCITLLFIIT